MLYELWESPDGGEEDFGPAEWTPFKQRTVIDAGFRLIWTVEASDFNDAMQKFYDYRGWGQYVPMGWKPAPERGLTTPQEAYETLLSQFVEPILARHGYVRSGTSFQKTMQNRHALIAFLKLSSQDDDPCSRIERVSLTIDLTVVREPDHVRSGPNLLAASSPEEQARGIVPAETIFSARIGDLMPKGPFWGGKGGVRGGDRWWSYDAVEDFDPLVAEVSEALEVYAIPRLEEVLLAQA